MKALIDRAREVLAPYQDPAAGPPDPSFVLQLPDDVYTNSNLYAVQKLFDGPFEFDVIYDSGSNKQKLTCECQSTEHTAQGSLSGIQHPRWTTASQLWLKHMENDSSLYHFAHKTILQKNRRL